MRIAAINGELAELESQRGEASLDLMLSKPGADARLNSIGEKIATLTRERDDLGLAVEEAERREAQAAERAKAAEREVLLAERDKRLAARDDLYDQVAVAIEQAAAIAAKCLEADEQVARILHALREPPEPASRQSIPRIESYLELRFAMAGFMPPRGRFNYPHPARRVRPRDW